MLERSCFAVIVIGFLTTNMDDASLNIIPVILAFSWIFSDKKIWMLLQSTSQFHSGHFCFLLNICWQKICKMLHHEYHSGQFCILLNIFWQKIWILFQSTSFRSFLLSPEYLLKRNINDASLNIIPVIFAFSWMFSDKKIWILIQSTSFRSFLLSPEYLSTKNMDNASSWTSFRSFLRSPEYLLKKYGFCFNQLHSGHFYFLLNICWQKIWTVLYWTSFRSFLHSPEYFLTKKNMDDALLNAIPVIFAFSWMFFDKKYGQCFTELYSGHFCGLNISHWHCLNQVNFCIFLRKI